MTRSPTLAFAGVILCGAAIVPAYLFIKPALHIAVMTAAALSLYLYCLQPAVARAVAPGAIAAGLGMPLLAWSLPNIWLLYAAMIALVPLLARRLRMVAPLYLFSVLLLPGLDGPVSIGGLKLLDFGMHDALATGAAVAVALSAERRPITRPELDLPAIGVILLLAAALARDTTLTNNMRMLANVVMDFAVPYYIVSRSIRTIEDLQACMVWLGCAGAILSAVLIWEVIKAWPIYNELYGHYGVPTLLLVKARGGLLRAGGPFVEPTSIAMMMVTCVLALWLSRRFFRTRLHHGLLLALLLVGVAAPQSRGAWVGLFLGVAVADAYRGRVTQMAAKLLPLAAAGALLFVVAQGSSGLSEAVGLTGGSAESGEYRRQLFDRGMEEFRRSPVWGYSLKDLSVRLADLRQGEGIIDFVNTYLWIMLISGGIGLGVFVGAFLFLLTRLWRARGVRRGAVGHRDVATFAVAALVVPMEMLFFTSFGGRSACFIFVAFAFSAVLLRSNVVPSPRPLAASPAEPARVPA